MKVLVEFEHADRNERTLTQKKAVQVPGTEVNLRPALKVPNRRSSRTEFI